MESVLIDVDPERGARPASGREQRTYNLSMDLLERAERVLIRGVSGQIPSGLASALGDVEEESTIDVDRADSEEFDFAGEVGETVGEDEWELGAGSSSFAAEDDDDGDEPAWLSEDRVRHRR